jgi:hypothetical protein
MSEVWEWWRFCHDVNAKKSDFFCFAMSYVVKNSDAHFFRAMSWLPCRGQKLHWSGHEAKVRAKGARVRAKGARGSIVDFFIFHRGALALHCRERILRTDAGFPMRNFSAIQVTGTPVSRNAPTAPLLEKTLAR